jgi:hypothetical protein
VHCAPETRKNEHDILKCGAIADENAHSQPIVVGVEGLKVGQAVKGQFGELVKTTNWFSLVQTMGIMAALMFTAVAARQNAKEKEIKNILALEQQHRALWEDARKRGDLKRVFDETAKLDTPNTIAENTFLNMALVHFQTGWQMSLAGSVHSPETQAADIRGFFSLPLPRAVWEKTKQFKNPKFVGFVTRALERHQA